MSKLPQIANRKSGIGKLLYLIYRNEQRSALGSIHPLSGFDKIAGFGCVNIFELLRIAVNKRKPAALHLNHEQLSLLECMEDIRQRIFYFAV
jgi:hypothetical protein